MTRIILARWGQTDWEAQGRLIGSLDLPLTPEGEAQVRSVAHELAALSPQSVISGPEEASRQTAAIIATRLGVRPRRSKDLHEIVLGHWSGLTDEQFRERFPSVYRQWRDDPRSVCPPEGEALDEAMRRLRSAVSRAARRGGVPLVVVSGPLAVAALRVAYQNIALVQFWDSLAEPPRWFELPDESPGATT